VLANQETKQESYKLAETKEDSLVDMLEVVVRVKDIQVDVDGREAE
jgi:hypothetical protein